MGEVQEHPLGTRRFNPDTGAHEVYAKKVGDGFQFEDAELQEAMEKVAELDPTLQGNVSIVFAPKPDPNLKFMVLHLTDNYGKRFTCRTVEELDTFIGNYKADKKLKRDEDMGIQIGFGRMTEAQYAKVPACKYFIKPNFGEK